MRVERPGRQPPDPIGEHQPDVTATKDGRFIIGVARTSYELAEQETTDALGDFLAWRDSDGERAVIHLAVPEGWKPQAEEAFVRAGGEVGEELNNVVSVGGLDVPPPD